MDVFVNYDYREDDLAPLLDIEALASFVICEEGRPDTTEVSISFVTDDEIHELNRDYRGIDRPTDVLSFECDNVDDDFMPEGQGGEDEPYELGDIVIAPDVAERQTAEFGTTFHDELCLLITHGLLHLCGWDHMTDEEADAMEARERELLTAFLGRPFER